MPPRPPWIVVLLLVGAAMAAPNLLLWALGSAVVLAAWWRAEFYQTDSYQLP